MNILIVSYYEIYPFEAGASIAQFGMIEFLSRLCDISLLLPENSTISKKEFNELEQLLPNVKIYKLNNFDLDEKVINNNNISIQYKLAKFLGQIKGKFFFKINIISSFLRKNLLGKTSYFKIKSNEENFADQYSLYNPFYHHSQRYIEKINEIIWQDRIDIVQLEFTENLSLVTGIQANVKKIFVEHESRFGRIKSHINAKNIKSLYADYVFNFSKTLEVSLIEKFDGIITFNKCEYQLLEDALSDRDKKPILFVSPYAVLESNFKKIELHNFSKPNKLLFVGGESHFPNKDAVEWFLQETAENIFKYYGLKLYVAGKWSQDTINKYKNHPSGVKFLGFVEDLYEVAKSSISIVPVRIGGGLRTKIMLAMAQGIPVITTKFALEGINAKHLESIMIAEDKNQFTWAVKYLLEDLERTYKICKNAQQIIYQDFSQPKMSEKRYSIYQEVLNSQNFNDRFNQNYINSVYT